MPTDVVLKDNLLPGQPKKRIWELDFVRGVCILLMVMDHTFFDIWYMFGNQWFMAGGGARKMAEFCVWYWQHPVRNFVHDIVLYIFFVLCGMSLMFSRNNYLHSIKILIVSLVLTVGTMAAEMLQLADGILIRFGVLHMLGVSSLICTVLYTLLGRNKKLQPYAFLLAAIVVYLVNVLYVGTREWSSSPDWLCIISERMGDLSTFSPGDHFALLGATDEVYAYSPTLAVPYLSRVMLGAAIVPLLYPVRKTLLPKLDRGWHKPVCFVGRHALVVVVAHQILLPLMLALVTGWFVTPGNYGLF